MNDWPWLFLALFFCAAVFIAVLLWHKKRVMPKLGEEVKENGPKLQAQGALGKGENTSKSAVQSDPFEDIRVPPAKERKTTKKAR